jgi:Restriction endonuclease
MAKCFVVMPISMLDIYADRYNDPEHFSHVLDHLFTPALEEAGYEAVRPTITGSDLIHAEIISNLETCDLVLCDISTLNPNVFFELGIRTSLDRPVALVRDHFTVQIPFDTGSINTHTYDASLQPWKLPSEVEALTLHVKQVAAKSGDRNALWRYFGLTQRASPAEISNPIEAKLNLLIDEVNRLAKRSDIVSIPPPPTSSLATNRAFQYEARVELTLTSLGYRVTHGNKDAGFDLLIEDESGRVIFAELKYLQGAVSAQQVMTIIGRSFSAAVPVLLITYSELTNNAREAASEKLEVVQWRDANDNAQLEETLRAMFVSMASSPRITTDSQPRNSGTSDTK